MTKSASSLAAAIVLTLMLSRPLCAADLGPVGDPVLDPPTLHCLGAYWIVRDNDASPATVGVAVRRKGEQAWKPAHPFLRVMHGPFRDEGGAVKPSAVDLPEGATLFAGSVLFLDPDTDYEMKLNLHLADGSTTERILSARTRGEPVAPDAMRALHVIPGNGGGSGTAADPFKGLAAADKNCAAGRSVPARLGEVCRGRPGTRREARRRRSSGAGKRARSSMPAPIWPRPKDTRSRQPAGTMSGLKSSRSATRTRASPHTRRNGSLSADAIFIM